MHATLADVIADTTQNAIEAGAKHVSLTLVEDGATIAVTIADDGKGMDAATQARAFNPFYTEPGKHDKRKVGLGLPILKQLCESTDGAVSLTSEKGVGTELKYSFSARHIDLPPMGDLVGMVMMLFNYPGEKTRKFRLLKRDFRSSRKNTAKTHTGRLKTETILKSILKKGKSNCQNSVGFHLETHGCWKTTKLIR